MLGQFYIYWYYRKQVCNPLLRTWFDTCLAIKINKTLRMVKSPLLCSNSGCIGIVHVCYILFKIIPLTLRAY